MTVGTLGRGAGTLALLLAVAAGCGPTADAAPDDAEAQAAAVSQEAHNVLTEAERAEGWRLLFDGETLDGWRVFGRDGMSEGWAVVDGNLTRVADGARDIITLDQFQDFEFSVEWMVEEGGNSGILYRVSEEVDPSTDGLMARALDLKSLIPIQEFYGRRDRDFFRFLSFWNAGRKERQLKTLEINTAPNSDSGNISFHVAALRSRLAPNKKLLHLGESKLLPAAFQELRMSDVSTAKDTDHPVLSALGYVVSALDEYVAYDRNQPEFAEMEYDIDSIIDR